MACDPNYQAVTQILEKHNCGNRSGLHFLYNRSILTRILHPVLKENNVLVICHYSRAALNAYLRHPTQALSRSIFTPLAALGFPLRKQKVSLYEALKNLEHFFYSDCVQIYTEIEQFRSGLQSLEVHATQSHEAQHTMFH